MKHIFLKSILLFLSVSFLISCSTLHSYQRNNPFKCGWYCPTMKEATAYYNTNLRPFELKAGDIVANVGSGSGWEECIWLMFNDSIHFYAQDIDKNCLSSHDIEQGLRFYSKLRGQNITQAITVVYGDEHKTNLPNHFFDKILLINTFHELTAPMVMLQDFYSKLKPHGQLIIKEPLALHPNDKHPVCGINLKNEQDIIAAVSGENFTFIKIMYRTTAKEKKPAAAIFLFERKE